MSIDHVTGEIIDLSEADARQLTDRIRTALDRVSTAWADLAERITEAYQRRADLALGYGSWSEYAEAELKPSEGLAADVRRQLVGMLTSAGMSPKAIAPTVGVDRSTISRDRSVQGVQPAHPEPERIDPATGEVESLDDYRGRVLADAEATGKVIKLTGPQSVSDPTPAKVVGLDGKTYTRPEPKASQRAEKRPPLPPQIESAGWDLAKSVERLQRIASDDRFSKHKNEMAPHLRSHLQNAVEVCQDLLERINN